MSLAFVGMALGQQGFGERYHGVNIVCGVRLKAGRQCIQCCHVFTVLGGEFIRYRFNGAPSITRRGNDFIVYVGNVARVNDFGVLGTQQASQHIKHHHRARIADVRQVVHRRATHVHGYAAWLQRLKGLLGRLQRVVDGDAHVSSPPAVAQVSRKPMVRLNTGFSAVCS